jgi:hypothetical protein
MPKASSADDYQWIRKWGSYMGSSQWYIDEQVRKARESNAPEDATFHRDDHGWYTVGDITNEMTRYQLGLRPLREVTERHEYEPGEGSHPMHTDPLCKVCGAPKKDKAQHVE